MNLLYFMPLKFLPKLHKRSPKPTFTEQQFHGLKAEMEKNEKWSDKMADFFTNYFGTVGFLILNGLFFLIWLLVNTGALPEITTFDPFPFGLLTTIVSLEAIFLSIIVLISQHRAGNIADLREELALQINVRAEEEITRILNMLDEIHDHLGLAAEDDSELKAMKQKIDLNKIKEQLLIELTRH